MNSDIMKYPFTPVLYCITSTLLLPSQCIISSEYTSLCST